MYILTYNGFTLQNDSNHTIDTLKGLGRVDIRKSDTNLTGGDGGNIWERRYAMRTIQIGGHIFASGFSSYYNLRSLMLSAFNENETSTNLAVTKSDGTVKNITAKVVGIPDFIETEGEYAEATYDIILQAENPFFFDTPTTTTITPGLTGGAPIAFPIPTPILTSGGTASISNTGDVANTASFIISGTITNPTITNQTTNQSFQLNTTITLGTTVTIYQDTLGFHVLLNGTTNYYQYFTGTFFSIAKGNNVIAFSGSSFDGSASLQIQYGNYYVGI